MRARVCQSLAAVANVLISHIVFGLRVKRRPFELRVLDKSYELLMETEEDASQQMTDRIGDTSPMNRLAEASSKENENARDCGTWWASWVGSCVNFQQVTQRCDAATAALQPVATAAKAAADEWASGAGHGGRAAAVRQ